MIFICEYCGALYQLIIEVHYFWSLLGDGSVFRGLKSGIPLPFTYSRVPLFFIYVYWFFTHFIALLTDINLLTLYLFYCTARASTFTDPLPILSFTHFRRVRWAI